MAGMNKADRAEFEARKDRLGHYERMALEQCIAYGLESKSAWLAAQREKEAAALAELNEGERAYAVECLASGATLEDAIEAAKEAAKRLAETDKETKAFVSIVNFGDVSQKKGLCDTINNLTLFHAYVNECGNVLIPCKIAELGGLLSQLSAFPDTNWIEYAVQFEC